MSRAIVVHEFDNYDSIKINNDYPLPELEKGMVEVLVHFLGLNFADLYMQCNLGMSQVPFVLGMECSGIVTQVSDENGSLKVGDKVICFNYKGGMFANKLRVSTCYKVPDFLSLKEAAGVFVNYMTAFFSVADLKNLNVRKESKLFITSCAGGVGLAAIQLARKFANESKVNLEIFGTCSEQKKVFISGLGVKYISRDKLDNELAEKSPQGLDLVLESQSTQSRQILMKHLRPMGRLVILGAKELIEKKEKMKIKTEIDPVELIYGNNSVGGLHLGVLAEKETQLVSWALDTVFEFMANDIDMRPIISNVYDFEDIVMAIREMAEERNVGKVIIKVPQNSIE